MDSSRLLRVIRAFAEALFSSPQGAPPGERLDWVCGEFSAALADGTPLTRFALRLSAFALTILAPLVVGRLPGLSRLPLELRVRALEKLEQSGWGAAPVLALKLPLCLMYYEHPDAAREVGYVELGKAGVP